tara:strand:- start:1528 stop:1719 length:192 start_codon:yes stop_codon:yes gene_type:complete
MGTYFSYQKFNNAKTLEIQKYKFNSYNNVITEYKSKYINEPYTKPIYKSYLFEPKLEKIDEEI